jgi:two-component system OmpR family response regulator
MRQVRILYVEDDPDIAQIGLLVLRLDPTIDVRLAMDGTEALRMLRDRGPWRPQLLLLDVMMPGLSGLDVLDMLAADGDGDRIQVVLMTARISEADLRHYRERGAIGAIAKPFNPLSLADDVLALLRQTALR